MNGAVPFLVAAFAIALVGSSLFIAVSDLLSRLRPKHKETAKPADHAARKVRVNRRRRSGRN